MRNNDRVTGFPQDTQQAHTIGAAGDARDNRAIFGQTALVTENGIDIIKHYVFYNTKLIDSSLPIFISDTTPPTRRMCFQGE